MGTPRISRPLIHRHPSKFTCQAAHHDTPLYLWTSDPLLSKQYEYLCGVGQGIAYRSSLTHLSFAKALSGSQVVLENLALRQQLAAYKRMMPRPQLRTRDRLLWVGLAKVWTGWRRALVIVSPDTVLRWQRRRFREYWTQLSRRPTGGRPPVNTEITAL